MTCKLNTIIAICTICGGFNASAGAQTVKPGLSDQKNFRLVNREISLSVNEQAKPVVHLNAKQNDGVAWIKDVNFTTGIIELDMKGKDIMQQSFVGLAFHGIDDSTYDVIYFRPFNFQSADSNRRKHSIQYVSLPKYDWSLLRENYPGKYEGELQNAGDADKWFHAKIIIDPGKVVVFVNGQLKPSLTVKPLSINSTGTIGFWVGNNSDGDFTNLSIQVNALKGKP
ncbi:MAG: hypothetical protein ABIN94_14880 [Ferruginibacter sp.]